MFRFCAGYYLTAVYNLQIVHLDTLPFLIPFYINSTKNAIKEIPVFSKNKQGKPFPCSFI